MKITRDILISFDLFEKLPNDFKTLENKFSYVLYYGYVEETLKLDIYKSEVVKNVNLSLYRGKAKKQQEFGVSNYQIGYFTNNLDSRDALFYLFLKTYYISEEVDKLYEYTIINDKQIELNVSTDSSNDVNSSEDFQKIISVFSPNRIQTIMFIYDMVNNALKNRLSKSLYGDYIKRVVNIIKYEGGILSEIGGKFRFMVIGENANLSSEEKKSLEEAKLLLRSRNKLEDIYLKTSWAFSPFDGKWRTNVSDNDAEIKNTYLTDYRGSNLYVPSTQKIDNIYSVLTQPEKLYSYNYQGVMHEVLNHPKLYKYYPKLKLLSVIYYYGDTIQNNKFYFSEDNRGGYILIHGNRKWGTDISILLHEIQHYIQSIEGFARGGNQFLAQFVSSVGAKSVRTIFSCIKKMQNLFEENFSSNEKRLELLNVINSYEITNPTSQSIKNALLQFLNDVEAYTNQKIQINFYLVLLIAEEGDIKDNEIVDYLYENIESNPTVLYELFRNIENGYKMAKDYRTILLSQGMSEEDLSTVLFSNYENLYGELESRSVQHSRLLSGMYNNYFYLTSWENSPYRQITIIDNIETILDIKDVVAAVERKDNDYVLHFDKSENCEPYLHELAHIVHDALVTLGYGDIIKEEYNKNLNINDIQEYFVNEFLIYIKNNVHDDYIIKDFQSKWLLISNTRIDAILNEFFSDPEMNARLDYLKKLLEL